MLRFAGVTLVVGGLACACGSRTPLDESVDADALPRPIASDELCDGLDQDLDGRVDEDFRDEAGRYVHDLNCGGCGIVCEPVPPALESACAVLEETAVCAATRCAAGLAPSRTGSCVPLYDYLCLPCTADADCGDLAIGRCDDVGGEDRCVIGCELGCPDGYTCDDDRCIPNGGSCTCDPGDFFAIACGLEDPEGVRCPGRQRCSDGVLSACEAPEETCNEVDDDCDGMVDEGYRDARGAYSLDIQNCGECGVDCTLSTIPEGDLVCGGDPFAPTCVLACPDAADGVQPGDRIDADLDIANGCECTVTSLRDDAGPIAAAGEALDLNCDGADGIVVESIYVAPDGDDDGPGSPTRPLETIGAAIALAEASFETEMPRPHIFVASGSYGETVHLVDGVFLHGGYRRDFLALEPNGFRVDVRATAEGDGPGGAALVAEGVGAQPTTVEWMSFRGRDGTMPSSAAFGAVLLDPGPALTLRDIEVRAGVPGAGTSGMDGAAGVSPMSAGGNGAPPRAALENPSHQCVPGAGNTVAGGEGGMNRCLDRDVSGGRGGSPSCPAVSGAQPAGARGRDAFGVVGGTGGFGGQDSSGPITGISCSQPVCCGLADFSVPTDFRGPEPGAPGNDGRDGVGGMGCDDPLGVFDEGVWMADTASSGTEARPGSGGGGGGAGGGTQMEWFSGACEFPDGLGGGGGGGGAGGCGGAPGTAGASGGPSVAILVRYTAAASQAPTITGVLLAPADGGRGGDGGAGGDGGRGGVGGFGGELPRADRNIPTLAGPFPGGRGGRGGNGGAGGGGGAGCGGGSIGIWLNGGAPDGAEAWSGQNDFELGRGGRPGEGGGGGAPGADGAEGGAVDVVVR